MQQAALVPELLVQDIQHSRAFYTQTLGFQIAYERPAQGFCYLTLGAAQLMIEQITDGARSFVNGEITRPFGRGMNLQIMVPDLAPILTKVSPAQIFHPLEDAWYETNQGFAGQRQVVISDPDGYLLRLAQDLGTQSTPPQGAIIQRATV